MEEKIKQIFQKYNKNAIGIQAINEELYCVILDDRKELFVKMTEDKEKIAWEYRCLLNLKGKVRAPLIYMPDGNYIAECIVIEKPNGKLVETFEEKSEIANTLGTMLANIHILELNEQRSEEELKKIWNKHILNKTLFLGAAASEILSKDICDEILGYLTKNMKVISENFELSMILGEVQNSDMILNHDNDTLIFVNYANAMIGDPAYDFAKVYEYYEMNEENIRIFCEGYEDIISLPENINEKVQVFLVLDYLEKIVKFKEKAEMKEKINKYLETIRDIIKNGI